MFPAAQMVGQNISHTLGIATMLDRSERNVGSVQDFLLLS